MRIFEPIGSYLDKGLAIGWKNKGTTIGLIASVAFAIQCTLHHNENKHDNRGLTAHIVDCGGKNLLSIKNFCEGGYHRAFKKPSKQ